MRPPSADRVIVALDDTTLAPALVMARQLRGLVRTVKVGSALFTACGPPAIQRLRALGFEVMLDLKFFDIPSTVELGCRAAAQHGVSLLTVHAAGGEAMLAAAVRGAREGSRRLRRNVPRVLAVTVLTSTAVSRSSRATTAAVVALAERARRAGCDGVVASAHEVRALRGRFGRQLLIVCPGIRPRGASRGDQQRIATPAEAVARGADALVLGRPVTAAPDPRAALRTIIDELEDG